MTFTDLQTGLLSGLQVFDAEKRVGDLRELWMEPEAILDPNALLYRTQTFRTGPDVEGVVLWGNTTLMPGRVGDEFFMTRGHRHLRRTHGELCVTVSGQGALLLMDEDRKTRLEEMSSGSTHWIDGRLAHRTVNTGDVPLIFLCAWPADCGHDYDEIARLGFGARLLNVGRKPTLIVR
ncbi:MAG TPA: glucose-6-phosphate isomerase family protein [Fimbriimonadaceae bacterium]|nr:glucose-6-phosphate isomerase family protein [Fimbriimonadaceae bacterium]